MLFLPCTPCIVEPNYKGHCRDIIRQSTGPTNNLLSNLTVILYVYKSFPRNKTIIAEYCLAQWITNLSRSFEIYWVRVYLVNCMNSAGIVNTLVYKTEPTFTGLAHSMYMKLTEWDIFQGFFTLFCKCWNMTGFHNGYFDAQIQCLNIRASTMFASPKSNTIYLQFPLLNVRLD